MKKILVLLGMVPLLWACEPEKVNPAGKMQEGANALADVGFDTLLTRGEVIAKLIPGTDSAESFALYIPEKLKGPAPVPVVLFFDPQGDGSLPLNKYKSLADEYRFILAASNNSRNGQPLGKGLEWYGRMYDFLGRHFPLTPNGIFVAGFSGGSKVAENCAMNRPEIAGLIACSGAIPMEPKPANPNFSLYALAGSGDFNMAEIKQLSASVAAMNVPVSQNIFKGKHEWPDLMNMGRAFMWMKIRMMRSGAEDTDSSLVKAAAKMYDKAAKASEAAKDPIGKRNVYAEALSLMQGLSDVSEWEKQKAEIEKSAAFQNQIKENENMMAEENKRKALIAQNFSAKDAAWWRGELAAMKQKANAQGPAADMERRLLGLIGVMVYSYATQTVNQGDETAAKKFLEIYTTAEPENNEHRYLTALLAAKKGDKSTALNELSKAVALGFRNKERMENEADFAALKSDPKWSQLISSMK